MAKILAIDDKRDNLVSLAALMKHLLPDCTVITALSGREGIERATSEGPDAILLDVKMPEMDGFETCRRLKSDAQTKHVPVIMITAVKTDPQSRIKGLEYGANAFLAKPIDPSELVSQVQVALRIKKAEDELREERHTLENKVRERTAALRREITERMRSEANLKAAYAKLEALWSVASLADASLKAVSDHVLGTIAKMTQSLYGFYGYVNEDESLMTIHSWSGEAMQDCYMVDKPQHFPICQAGVWAEAIRRREPLILNDYAADYEAKKGLPEGHVDLTRLLVVPFFTHGKITAVAAVANRTTDYGQEDVSQIRVFLQSVQAITDGKQAEEALRESEERYRRITQAVTDYIYTVHVEGGRPVETLHGPGCVAVTGYTSEELAADPSLWIRMVVPEDQPLALNQARRILSGEEMPVLEHRIVRKDGAERWIRNTPVAYRDAEGRLISYDGLVQDITEWKKAAEETNRLEERLQRAEKMEALGTLAGGVAHDLNNVLGIVVGYAGMLLDGADASVPIRSELMNILSGGERAAAIVQDLLTLARRGVANRKVLNLSRFISDYRNAPEFKTLSSYHPSVQIKFDLEPNSLNLSGSPVHIGKTLFNLVANGCEAMPNGGFLTIRTANQYIDRPVQGYDDVREGDYIVLSVSDTGEGIPEEDLKRIFEPFYTKKVMGRSGTGLGLAVVWGTVKDHHGYINVQSEEGKGSVFTLYFPVTREEITADPTAAPVAQYMGRGESILIVDDVKGQRDLASAMLGKLNYRVSVAAGGEEAVAYLEEHPVDLLVLDMIMDPGMDGLETYRRVLEIHPRQKAIIVSGFSESERVSATQSLGAGAYVRKPYVIETLGLAVRKELDRQFKTGGKG